MSDFFGTLVERLMPALPAVAPRRSAHFELLLDEAPAVADVLTPVEPPPAVMRPATEVAPPPREPASPMMPVRELPASPVAPRAAAPLEPPPRPRARRDATPAAAAASTRREVVTTVVTVPMTPEPRRAPPDRIAEAVAPRPLASRDDEPPRRRREPPAERAPAAAAAVASPSPRAPAIVPAVERATAPAPRADATSRRDRQDVAASPPRIEVTIGTVEVRAQMTAPAPALPVSAPREYAPPVSLNDYLRQRGARA